VRADLAGIDPAGIALEIRGRELVLAGRRPPESGEDRIYQQLEIEHGPFRRVVALGADVDAEAATAAYEDGMLIVELPLVPPRRPHNVPIDAGRISEES
jgi:HSP20 family protein